MFVHTTVPGRTLWVDDKTFDTWNWGLYETIVSAAHVSVFELDRVRFTASPGVPAAFTLHDDECRVGREVDWDLSVTPTPGSHDSTGRALSQEIFACRDPGRSTDRRGARGSCASRAEKRDDVAGCRDCGRHLGRRA